jgi:hypothetical protein
MRSLAPLVLVALLGCDASGPCGAPTFEDPDGLGGLDALRDAFDAWVGWAGAGRVCLGAVEVGEADDSYVLVPGAWGALTIDPDVDDPANTLHRGLCQALDLWEGLLDADPTLYAEWRDPAFLFTLDCGAGPRAWDLLDATGAACGDSPALTRERLLRDVVYPLAPALTPGSLALSDGGIVRLDEGAGAGAGQLVAVGALADALIVVREAPAEKKGTSTITAQLVDPDTGAVTTVLTHTGPTPRTWLYTGPDAAALLLYADDVLTVWTMPADGPATSRAPDLRAPVAGAVSGGTLYTAHDYFPTALDTLDLATGALGTVAIPDVPHDLNINALAAAPGGDVLAYGEVEIDGPSATIGSPVLARYDAATATWIELARDLGSAPVGVTADGRLVGAWAGGDGLGYGTGGGVAGAWDLTSGTLAVASTVCTTAVGAPDAVTSDRAWWATRDARGVLLTGHRF